MLILGLLAIVIHLFSRHEHLVEKYYSTGVYPYIGNALRLLTGWVPFSLGDWLYLCFVFWVLFKLWKFCSTIKRNGWVHQPWKEWTFRALRVALVLYVTFNILWGLNYNRTGIAAQVDLEFADFNEKDLKALNLLLVEKVNHAKQLQLATGDFPNVNTMFVEVAQSFSGASKMYPFLRFKHTASKKSIWGWLGNMSGFTGYYNPFTGEAQTNTSVPVFMQPFIMLHESAHQLGYAKEQEANFVAFLVMEQSSNTHIRYSGYLDMFLYANRNLYYADSTAAREYRKQLNTSVISDINTYREFLDKHRAPFAPAVNWLYGKFLTFNRQPSGMRSYDEVTACLIAYYKKNGKI